MKPYRIVIIPKRGNRQSVIRLMDRRNGREDGGYFYGIVIKRSDDTPERDRESGFYLSRKYIDYDTLEEALEAFDTEAFIANL